MTIPVDLKPCPFCGNGSLKIAVDEGEWEIARVSCQASLCYALGPYVELSDHETIDAAKAEAVALWNDRLGEHP